jgi:hypothetical protein
LRAKIGEVFVFRLTGQPDADDFFQLVVHVAVGMGTMQRIKQRLRIAGAMGQDLKE